MGLSVYFGPAPYIISVVNMASAVRHNYHEECEAMINKQINMELHASYVYLSMKHYFERDDVALHGIAKFFSDNSEEEKDHADKLMKYQNKRGGRVLLQKVEAPECHEWGNILTSLEVALKLERKVNKSRKREKQLSNFVEFSVILKPYEALFFS